MDAGFFTAMHIKRKWLRDLLSMVFSFTYLFFPEAAEEKVRRTSLEKSVNPYLSFLTFLDRGFLRIRRNVVIPLPKNPSPTAFENITKTGVNARLYYSGTKEELAKCTRLIFHIPGGGFVAMSPENHDDFISAWARQTKVPIISIKYGKAPENPFPWGLEECFEAYRSIVESNGKVIGFEGWHTVDAKGKKKKKDPIDIVFVGDSAGGNLISGVIIRCIEYYEGPIRLPEAAVLIYPCLTFDLECWMKPEYLNYMRTESHISLSQEFIKSKKLLRKLAPLSVDEAPRSIDVLTDKVDRRESFFDRFKPKSMQTKEDAGPYIHSYLSMTSRLTYFADRLLTPELMRAMAIMYLAESPLVPDLQTDYYLSPILAPPEILARFPKTYFLCGEKDPLVDDTVVFANKIREAKLLTQQSDQVHTKILPGLSHAFFQVFSILPEAKQSTTLVGNWILKEFNNDRKPDLDMNQIDETSLLKRRRHELASELLR